MPNHPRYHLRGQCFCSECGNPISYRNTSGKCKPCKHANPKYWKRYNGIRVHVYTWIFLTEFGPGPHPCVWCGDPIEGIPLIHHIDEDHSNHDITNLAPLHHGCHTALHQSLPSRKAVNKRISKGMKRYWNK